jgi:hypothetical protein
MPEVCHLAPPERAFGFLHKEFVLLEFVEDESSVAQVLGPGFVENQYVVEECHDETSKEWL